MLLGKVLRHALHALHERGRQAAADVAVHQQHAFARAIKAACKVVQQRVVAEVVHHRAMWAPAEGLGQLEAVAVERPQLDDADAVQLRQVLDALGLRQAVVARHLLQRPLAQHTDRHQQQLLVGHHGLFLLVGQLFQQGLLVGHAPGQVGKVQRQCAADGVDAR